jgi:radical SAM superfamily enzyme YgiQ (UPF0313 family)
MNRQNWEGLALSTIATDADILAISLNYSLFHNQYLSVLKRMREDNPYAKIIVGGNHAPSLSGYPSISNIVNTIVLGNGELPLFSIIQKYQRGEKCERIIESSSFADQAETEELHNSEYFGFLDRMQLHRYDEMHKSYPAILYKGLPSRQVFLQRRCGFFCSHCAEDLTSYPSKFRVSIESTIKDIQYKNRGAKANQAYFLDPTFNIDRERVIELCKGLQKGAKDLIWGCKARIDLLDKEMISIMYQAGCRFIEVGIEATDRGTQKSIGKSILHDKIKSVLDYLTCIGISTQCNFILGLPIDDGNIIQRRIETAHKLMESYNILPCFWLFCPFPGSKLWSRLKIEREELNWDFLSILPVLRYGMIRHEYSFLPRQLTASQMTELLSYAWKMPANRIRNWLENNQLLGAALRELSTSFEEYTRSLFPNELGDFINSRFFIVNNRG